MAYKLFFKNGTEVTVDYETYEASPILLNFPGHRTPSASFDRRELVGFAEVKAVTDVQRQPAAPVASELDNTEWRLAAQGLS